MRSPRSSFRLSLLLATVALAALAGAARPHAVHAAPTLSVTKVDIASQNPPHVAAHVTVAAPTRIPIPDLTPDRFQVTVDGQPVSNLDVKAAPNDAGAVAVVLALDTSGSMDGPKLESARQAAKTFVSLLNARDALALVQFDGNGVRTLVPLSTDHQAALTAIDKLAAFGNTPLWDAVDRGINLVKDRNDGPRAVVVMTDGGDEPRDPRASLSLDTVVGHAVTTQVPVFAVGLGQDVASDPLQKLTADSGGQYLESPTPDQLNGTFGTVAKQLRQEYVATFDAPALNHEATYNLRVAVNVNGERGEDGRSYTVPAVIPAHVTLQLRTPAANTETSSDVPINADVSPDVSVQSVRFLVDGQPIGTANKAPFTATWHVAGATTGDHTLSVEATGADNQTERAQVTVHYTDPHVSARLLAPTDHQRLTGDVPIEADLSPAASVRAARFSVDGKELQTLTQPPWRITWHTKDVLIGAHTVQLDATGADGQTETLQATVTVGASGGGSTPIVAGIAGFAVVIAIVLAAMFIARSRRRQASLLPVAAGSAGGALLPSNGRVAARRNGGPPVPELEDLAGGRRWPLGDRELLIGRDVPDADVRLPDPDMSRQHARIVRQNGGWVFEDLGPTNPSLINGEPYAGPHALQDGDELRIGGTPFRFSDRPPA